MASKRCTDRRAAIAKPARLFSASGKVARVSCESCAATTNIGPSRTRHLREIISPWSQMTHVARQTCCTPLRQHGSRARMGAEGEKREAESPRLDTTAADSRLGSSHNPLNRDLAGATRTQAVSGRCWWETSFKIASSDCVVSERWRDCRFQATGPATSRVLSC